MAMDYDQLYAMLGDLTPLRFDCGGLCAAACCADSDAGDGMLLAPGEVALLEGEEGFSILPCYVPKYGTMGLLTCPGHCRRDMRPLSCRIFPLYPRFLPDGSLRASLDPRARAICPLAHMSVAALDPAFRKAVLQVFEAMAQDAKGLKWLQAVSAQAEDHAGML